MVEIRIQDGEGEAALLQCPAVACMLLQHYVIERNSQVNRGESPGKIASWDTNNGMLEHVLYLSFPLCSEFAVNEFSGSDVLDGDTD